uniref:Uncharacterized protein n=1 Tax=Timema douglasi TaxID=61478 RepID=A0A7R8VJD7_TIMDO|nr:unnamed protein product [Timema douglasi]
MLPYHQNLKAPSTTPPSFIVAGCSSYNEKLVSEKRRTFKGLEDIRQQGVIARHRPQSERRHTSSMIRVVVVMWFALAAVEISCLVRINRSKSVAIIHHTNCIRGWTNGALHFYPWTQRNERDASASVVIIHLILPLPSLIVPTRKTGQIC